MPNTSAPNGLAASVRVLATTTLPMSVWNSVAMALNMNTIRKKSKASSVQPRKLAATAAHSRPPNFAISAVPLSLICPRRGRPRLAFLGPGLDQLEGDGHPARRARVVQLALDQPPGLVAGEPAHLLQFGVVGGGVVVLDLADQPDHQRRWVGPGLRGVVAHAARLQPGLFLHLARAGLLD